MAVVSDRGDRYSANSEWWSWWQWWEATRVFVLIAWAACSRVDGTLRKSWFIPTHHPHPNLKFTFDRREELLFCSQDFKRQTRPAYHPVQNSNYGRVFSSLFCYLFNNLLLWCGKNLWDCSLPFAENFIRSALFVLSVAKLSSQWRSGPPVRSCLPYPEKSQLKLFCSKILTALQTKHVNLSYYGHDTFRLRKGYSPFPTFSRSCFVLACLIYEFFSPTPRVRHSLALHWVQSDERWILVLLKVWNYESQKNVHERLNSQNPTPDSAYFTS